MSLGAAGGDSTAQGDAGRPRAGDGGARRRFEVRPVWQIFLILSAVHLGAQLYGSQGLADLTQMLLMPALAFSVIATGVRGRLITWLLIGLGLSWLGDTVPQVVTSDGTAFLLMAGFFLLAQVAYVIAFFPVWRRATLSVAARVVPVLVYAAVAFVLVRLCADSAGSLLLVVIAYAVVLCAMAVLAVSLGLYGAVGGALFVISDGLLAVREFTAFEPPMGGFFVMLTYIGAQAALVSAAVWTAGREGRPR